MLKLLQNKLPESKSTKKLVTLKSIETDLEKDDEVHRYPRSLKKIASNKNIILNSPPHPQTPNHIFRDEK